MLDDKAPTTRDASPDHAGESVLELREMLVRMQAELQFEKTRNAALNFEVARLKRWRFGSSSESLDATTQAGLFDAILADTLLEDIAGQQAAKPGPPAPAKKRQAVRQALPAKLPRTDHHYELEQTHCACGNAFKRIGEEVSEQLDCVPAQCFVLRHIRGKYAWRLLRDDPGGGAASADDRQGHPRAWFAGAGGRGQARRSSAAVPPDRD